MLAVIRELFGRAKRRYVDEYCSAQPLRKQQPPQLSAAAFFDQGHDDSLERLSSRASRRFFSADDASTISKRSTPSDMSLYAATLSPESFVYGSSVDLSPRVKTRILQEKARALETVQGRTSVTVGIIANNTAKDERRREGGMDSPAEIVRSASTGRRYTYPHINTGDPHGRIAELISRVNPSAGITSSVPSTLSGSNGGGEDGREEEEGEGGRGVEEEPGKEEEYYYYPFIRRVYQICFPCFIPKDKKDEFVHIMPMHLVRGDQGIRRTAMDSTGMNEMWSLNAVRQHRTIRRGASANSRGSRRAFNTIHGNAMDGQLGREEQPIQMVEPYAYPRFAMFVHWLLINVFRVKPTVQQDKERPVELIDVTGRRVAAPPQPIMTALTPNIEHTNFRNQNQQSRTAQIIAEASNNNNKRESGNSVEENTVADGDDHEDPDNFFKRSSIRAVSFSPSSAAKTDPNKAKPESISRTVSNTSSQNEERLRHPSFGHDNDDPKGKRPVMERLRSLEREPPFVSLLPGKDNTSRKSVKSADGSPPSAEKFVVTITDTGGGPTHQEVYPVHPVHPADKPTKESNNQQHRPGLFRRVSDMSPQQWTKDKSLLQHVWGRGTSPSKSIKIAKQFAERVGDTSIVKSMNNRYGSTSSPTSEDLSEGLSPPQSLQFQSPSPESSHSELYAQALDARPHHVTKKPKRKHSVDTIMSPTTQFDPSTAKTLMLDDFGMEHFVQPNDRPQPTETERRVIDQAVESIYGFSSGATRVIYVRSWDQDGMNRVVVREEPWDYDTVILRALQEF